jgi:hypothetical protein
MNTKQMSKIRRKAKHILVEWLQSLLTKEEASKINYKNVFAFMPNQTHYYHGDTFRLQPWSYKWIVKKLKRNPALTIDDLNAMLQPTEKQLRRQKMAEQGPL